MQAVDLHAERARKNRLLALGLFAASLVVLGLMIAVVFGVRSGALPRLIAHFVKSMQG